jgi:hypothetical protein
MKLETVSLEDYADMLKRSYGVQLMEETVPKYLNLRFRDKKRISESNGKLKLQSATPQGVEPGVVEFLLSECKVTGLKEDSVLEVRIFSFAHQLGNMF